MARHTEFSYECSCGRAGPWYMGDGEVRCPACGHRAEVDRSGMLLWHKVSSNQIDYFNPIYAEGRVNVLDAGAATRANPYAKAVERASYFLKLCGVNTDLPTSNLSFLEIACGSGIITAGLLEHPNLQHCRMHAFDLSTYGPAMLAEHAKTISTTSRLELSAQDAQDMKFAPESFDVIIGDAVLHHLDRYREFLMKCRQLLKPGGVAIFGEPFAFGYALAAIALKLAQEVTGVPDPAIDAFYDNIGKRIRYAEDAEFMIKMVDKHLFVPADLAQECQRAGLEHIQFVSRQAGQYYSERFVGSILDELNVASPVVEEKARAIFKTIYDEFGETRFVDSMSAFMEVIMRRSEYNLGETGAEASGRRISELACRIASLKEVMVMHEAKDLREHSDRMLHFSRWLAQRALTLDLDAQATSARVAAFRAQRQGPQNRIAELQSELAEHKSMIAVLRSQNSSLQSQNAMQLERVAALEEERNTFGGQVGRWLTRTRKWLAPPASLQGRLVSAGVYVVRAVRRFMLSARA
jgi:ubiquinone/menaquinone biosynthesis C-methylase UbiE